MDRWLRWARYIDRFNDRVGRALYWLTLVMVGVGAFNAIARYLDKYTGLGLSSNITRVSQYSARPTRSLKRSM